MQRYFKPSITCSSSNRTAPAGPSRGAGRPRALREGSEGGSRPRDQCQATARHRRDERHRTTWRDSGGFPPHRPSPHGRLKGPRRWGERPARAQTGAGTAARPCPPPSGRLTPREGAAPGQFRDAPARCGSPAHGRAPPRSAGARVAPGKARPPLPPGRRSASGWPPWPGSRGAATAAAPGRHRRDSNPRSADAPAPRRRSPGTAGLPPAGLKGPRRPALPAATGRNPFI